MRQIERDAIRAFQNDKGFKRSNTCVNMINGKPHMYLHGNLIAKKDENGELSVTQELGTNRGSWSAGITYNARDIVKDSSNNNVYLCNTTHTSTGTSGQGFAGSGGSSSTNDYGGSGGGAAGAASGGTGGEGVSWFNGIAASGGGVGRGFSANLPTIQGTYGRGGTAFSTYGSTANGRDGGVVIRYAGTPVATGGTISEFGGYTYHRFASSSAFIY